MDRERAETHLRLLAEKGLRQAAAGPVPSDPGENPDRLSYARPASSFRCAGPEAHPAGHAARAARARAQRLQRGFIGFIPAAAFAVAAFAVAARIRWALIGPGLAIVACAGTRALSCHSGSFGSKHRTPEPGSDTQHA